MPKSGFNLMDRLKSIEQSQKRRRSSSDKSRKKTRRSGTDRRTATVTSELLKFPQDIGELIGDQQRKSYIKKGIRPLPKNVRKKMKKSEFLKIMRRDAKKGGELQRLFMMDGIEFIPEKAEKASKKKRKTKQNKKYRKKSRKKSRKKKRTKHR